MMYNSDYYKSSALYIRTKRKNLKWYKKFWNYITGHKEKNWEWALVGPTSEVIK